MLALAPPVARAASPAAPSKLLMLMEGRALPELGAFFLMRPFLSIAPRGDGHKVLVLPGLMANDDTTRPLRDFLNGHGYDVHGWGQGRNLGPRDGVEDSMERQIDELYADGARKVSLIGWSLGGLYARELAKKVPDKVRCVITLGTPFAGPPTATNAWRVYELASGLSIEDPDLVNADHAEPPPVPSTSIFSRTDGICAWRGCLNPDAPLAENVEVVGSHCGLAHHPAAVYAIADRLAQPDGDWKKFDRSGWRAFSYPDWQRA